MSKMQGPARRPTLAVRRQEMASFLTSSMVGSKCVLYLARGCHRSYCAWRFFPAQHDNLSVFVVHLVTFKCRFMCVLYLARGRHLSYRAWRFSPCSAQ